MPFISLSVNYTKYIASFDKYVILVTLLFVKNGSQKREKIKTEYRLMWKNNNITNKIYSLEWREL